MPTSSPSQSKRSLHPLTDKLTHELDAVGATAHGRALHYRALARKLEMKLARMKKKS
jgi:hypothetical protein